MKIKLFTHTDLDGVGCGILATQAFGNDVDIEYCDYGNIDRRVKDFYLSDKVGEYTQVYITDISVGEEVALLIDGHQTEEGILNTTLLDHHATAEWLNKYPWATVTETTPIHATGGVREEKTCGTRLFYKELKGKGYNTGNGRQSLTVTSFVELVRKYDTWLWKTEYNTVVPKQLNDLFYILGRERFVSSMMGKIQKGKSLFSSGDFLLLEVEQDKIDNYIRSKERNVEVRYIQGLKCGVVFAEQYHSELGNVLSENNTWLDCIVIIDLDRSVSYRTSREGIDLGKVIAKPYGGGGHPQSAGSPIDVSVPEEVMRILFDGGMDDDMWGM